MGVTMDYLRVFIGLLCGIAISISKQELEIASLILQISFLTTAVICMYLYTAKEFAAATFFGNCYFSVATASTALLFVEIPLSFVPYILSLMVIPLSITPEALFSLARLCNKAKLPVLEQDIRGRAMRMEAGHCMPHPEIILAYLSGIVLIFKLL